MQEDNDAPLDVEKLVEQIRQSVKESTPPATDTSAAAEEAPDLAELVEEANRRAVIGAERTSGLRGLLCRLVRLYCRPLVGEINRSLGAIVRVQNKLARMLTTNETATESEVLAQTRRRIDLLTHLAGRLDRYDELDLEDRLRRIEQRLDTQEGGDRA